MTVQTDTNVATGIGNGVTTVFPIGFKFNRDEDLVVLSINDATAAATKLTLDSDYSVQGAGDEGGGSITILGAAPVTGVTIKITRVCEILQLTDLRNQGKFFAEVHEDAFDLFVMIMQQLFEAVQNSMQLNEAGNRWDGEGHRIIDLADPVDAQDAATLAWVQTYLAQILQTTFGPVQTASSIVYVAPDGLIYTVQDLSNGTSPDKGPALVSYNPELAYTGGLGAALQSEIRRANRNFSTLPLFANKYQFGGTIAHYLSDNAVVINGDSITEGANGGYFMQDGWAYIVRRALMKAYNTTSFGYLSVKDYDGFIDNPTGAFRYYQPETDGTIRENNEAQNAIGGVEVELGASEFVSWEFNRLDKYGEDIVPNQRIFRLAFNDSTGSVRVTAQGIDYALDSVIAVDGIGVTAWVSLPLSWDGKLTVTQETGTPVINGVVFARRESDYCVHMLYRGGRALRDLSDTVISQMVTGADLYIHALGVNDQFVGTGEAAYQAKLDTLTAALEASRETRVIAMDFVWMQGRDNYTRRLLRAFVRGLQNEAHLIDIPQRIANGGAEYSIDDLKSTEIKFLSADGVHPFLNGHAQIANFALAEIGLPQGTHIDLAEERRETLLSFARGINYHFGGRDFSRCITGWVATSGQTITYEEGVGVICTGSIFAPYIETRIPVTEDALYEITVACKNIDSDGRISIGTRSLDMLGNEIFEQDSVGSLAGNLPVSSVLLAAGERRVFKFVVGGRNGPSGTDPTKFEPGAAYFNLALNINNGWTAGSFGIESINIQPAYRGKRYDIPLAERLNGWVRDGSYLSVEQDADGTTRLFGRIKSGANGSVAHVLREGFRPRLVGGIGETVYHTLHDVNGGYVSIAIFSNGNIQITGTGTAGWNDRIQLNGIVWQTKTWNQLT